MNPLRSRLIIIALLTALFFPARICAAATRKLTVFYSPGCHRCLQIKKEVIPAIENKFKEKISIEYRDIDNLENYKLLVALEEKYGIQIKNVLPVFFLGGRFLNAQAQLPLALEALISEALKSPAKPEEDLPAVDLISRFKGFGPFMVVSAGLIDGINPCAFTVIVFFISFLALQGYKKRELTFVGLSFILAVCLTYILIGLGIFSFLYRLEGFWLVSRIANISIGIFSIVLGGIALYDFFKFKKSGVTEGLVLQLPQVIKNQIHKVIGAHYRKNKENTGKGILGLIISALITGFLVSILEAVCTGQTYLPTISFILKTSTLKLRALWYLVIYNLMFIVPLLVVFIFALWGATSQDFAKFLKRHLLTVKVLMALLFFSLGIFLIWRA